MEDIRTVSEYGVGDGSSIGASLPIISGNDEDDDAIELFSDDEDENNIVNGGEKENETQLSQGSP